MNPLARLMERMRRSAPAGKVDAGATNATPAQAGRPREYPYMNVPGAEPRANEEPAAMYPYPPQPQAYPQSPYPYAPQQQPAAAAIPAAPQHRRRSSSSAQPAYPPNYAQPQQYPPHFAPQPAAYPYPPAPPPQPAFHAWQAQPVAFDVYGRPQPVAAPYRAYPTSAPQAPAASYPAGTARLCAGADPLRPRTRDVADRGGAREPARIPRRHSRPHREPRAPLVLSGEFLGGFEFTAPDGAMTGLRRRFFVRMPRRSLTRPRAHND